MPLSTQGGLELMPITSIANDPSILFYLEQLDLDFSKPQMKHLANLMTGIVGTDGKRNILNMSSKLLQSRDRSCITKFLNTSPWDVKLLNQQRIKNVLSTIKVKDKDPIFLAIDDTVIPKNPDTKHMDGLGYHFSHVEGKAVWSHCIVSSQLITDKYSVPLGFEQYLKKDYCLQQKETFQSKLDIACKLLELFKTYNNTEEHLIYTLTDSWFTSKKIIEKSLSYGYHLIGGLKLNRSIYPQGVKVKISNFVDCIEKSDLNVVTVKDKKYQVYRYEGKVSGVDSAVVLICWENEFGGGTPKCILSTDVELSSKTILKYYARRWEIETSFLYLKDRLGLKHYQMRSLKGFNRFWSIVYLAYTYLELQRVDIIPKVGHQTLGDVIRLFKGVTFKHLLQFVYEKARNNTTLDELFKIFKFAV